MRLGLNLLTLAVLSSLLPTAATAQNLVSNGTFDSGIEGWMTDGTGPGTISWDATRGQPPGALRFPDFNQSAISEECLIPQVGTYTLSTDAYMETSGEFVLCTVNFFLYQSTDCSGEGGEVIILDGPGFPSVTEANTWQRLETDFGILPIIIEDPPFYSMRPMLIKSGNSLSDDTCLFDNVSLTFTPIAAAEIPAVGPLGLAVLAALLGAAGLLILRRLATG